MWVKICGITTVAQAQQVAALKPDAIGLNFYAPSPRSVSIETAAEIVAAVAGQVQTVGVFVDHSPAEIVEIAQRVRLDIIQLHGNYDPSTAAELDDRDFIWVYRLGGDSLDELTAQCRQLQQLPKPPLACLIDARVTGHYGGSGKVVNWDLLAQDYPNQDFPPLILAGGLTPDNISDAIGTVQPWGVDTASGVEIGGLKDAQLCERFVQQARST